MYRSWKLLLNEGLFFLKSPFTHFSKWSLKYVDRIIDHRSVSSKNGRALNFLQGIWEGDGSNPSRSSNSFQTVNCICIYIFCFKKNSIRIFLKPKQFLFKLFFFILFCFCFLKYFSSFPYRRIGMIIIICHLLFSQKLKY